jgi:hypothetical protein
MSFFPPMCVGSCLLSQYLGGEAGGLKFEVSLGYLVSHPVSENQGLGMSLSARALV